MPNLFYPYNIPISNSFAVTASVASSVTAGGFPQTASSAEYITGIYGPTGPVYKTVTATTASI